MFRAVDTLSPRQARWLFLREPDHLTDRQQRFVATRCENEEVERVYHLVQAFATIVRQRQGEKLHGWVVDAAASGVPELRGFVDGLRRDWEAVLAGTTLRWSNGQTEGQITRLKLLKRQMYGRAIMWNQQSSQADAAWTAVTERRSSWYAGSIRDRFCAGSGSGSTGGRHSAALLYVRDARSGAQAQVFMGDGGPATGALL
jgi:hypothetical protein